MILSKSKIFLFCLIFFILGIGLASFLPSTIIVHDIAFFVVAISSLILLIFFWKNKRARLIFFLALFLFLGIWRYSFSVFRDDLGKIWHYNGQTLNLSGRICGEPNTKATSQQIQFCVDKYLRTPLGGKVLVTTNLYPEYKYGEKLNITCDLEAPTSFNDFAYDKYLARYNIYSVCYYPLIRIERGDSLSAGDKFFQTILAVKNKFKDKINSSLVEPEASLANAITLGYKKNLPDDLRVEFSEAGISHIVAISGMHISIIAIILMAVFLGLGFSRRYSFYFSTLFLFLYIILVGMPASAMRAGLMGFLVLWAMNLGRLNKATNSIALAAVILLLFNPLLLRYDVGFQLSFLAVLGIIYFYPSLNNFFENKLTKFSRLPKKFLIVLKIVINIFSMTIAAQILTLPIIAFNFNQASIISPFSNLLILWILPFLLTFIFIALALSFLLPFFSVWLFLPAFIFLKYIIFTAETLIKIPYSFVTLDYLWAGWLIIYYLIVFGFWLFVVEKIFKKKSSPVFDRT